MASDHKHLANNLLKFVFAKCKDGKAGSSRSRPYFLITIFPLTENVSYTKLRANEAN